MKTISLRLATATVVLGLAFASCKKESTTVESYENTDTVMTTEPDTTSMQNAPLNDSSASGTTSGEMEQVP